MAINPFGPAEQATGLDELLNPKLAILRALTSQPGPTISPAAMMPLPSSPSGTGVEGSGATRSGNTYYSGGWGSRADEERIHAGNAASEKVMAAKIGAERSKGMGDLMANNPLHGLAGEALATAQGARATAIPGANEVLMERKGKPLESIDDTVGNAAFGRMFARNPEQAKVAYQAMTGRNYDEDYKAKSQLTGEIAAFPRKTIMSMIGQGKLRQRGDGAMGQWEQLETVVNDLGQREEKWVPANQTTLDMLMRAGGPSGVGLSDYTNGNPLAQEHLRRVSRGENPETVKADIASRIAASGSSPVGATAGPAPTNPNQVEGLIPMLKRNFMSAGPEEYASGTLDSEYEMQMRQQASKGKLATIMSNLGTQIMGGELRDEPAIGMGPVDDRQMYNELRLRKGFGPVSEGEWQAFQNKQIDRNAILNPKIQRLTAPELAAQAAMMANQLRLQ